MSVAPRAERRAVPHYVRVERDLEARILAGEFAAGGGLPSEAELCRAYGVSRITVRRSLERLAARRLITRRQGLGSFVRARPHGVNSMRVVAYLDDSLAYIRELRYDVLSLGPVRPSAAIAADLALAPGQWPVRLEAVLRGDAGAFASTDFFFPPSVGAALRSEDIEDHVPVLRVIERLVGKDIDRGSQTFHAIAAPTRVAARLGVAPRTPILQARRIYHLADDTPIEAAVVHYHPDRFDAFVELVAHVPRD